MDSSPTKAEQTLTLDAVRTFFSVPKWMPDVSAIGPLVYASDSICIYPVKVENGDPATYDEMAKEWPQQVEAGYNNILYVNGEGMTLRWLGPARATRKN